MSHLRLNLKAPESLKKELIPPPILPITLKLTIVATHQPEYSYASIY